MILLTTARARLLQAHEVSAAPPATGPPRDGTEYSSSKAAHILSRVVPIAVQAARILADFRKLYGLKISPAWFLLLQAVTASVLMQDPGLTETPIVAALEANHPHDQITDSHAAFDEVFRCLLGSGVEILIARGIARMMYHTAIERKIVLSQSTRAMLQIMSDTAWQPSDLSLVNSMFPNFASTKVHEPTERLTELLTKWEDLHI
jgi:hypothetical protein